MGGPIVGSGIRFYSRMGDRCSGLACVDCVRRANGEAQELGAGAVFPARVESHCCCDSLRNESEVSGRLPRVGALVGPEVDKRTKNQRTGKDILSKEQS